MAEKKTTTATKTTAKKPAAKETAATKKPVVKAVDKETAQPEEAVKTKKVAAEKKAAMVKKAATVKKAVAQKPAEQKVEKTEPQVKKTRYSDAELEEFRAIIHEKLKLARHDYDVMMRQIMNADGNDVDDTSPTYKALEEGSLSQSKEELMNMAYRQQKFIQGLEAALVRIENKTYGIDRMTGELIPKERLRAVPHATLSVASKNARKK